MNKTLLRFTLLSVEVAEFLLPIVWKIGVAAFHLLLGIGIIFLVMIVL